jgi:hypothetical protein
MQISLLKTLDYASSFELPTQKTQGRNSLVINFKAEVTLFWAWLFTTLEALQV